MAQNMGQLTDMWMVNPTMFDPTQASNQFSNYNSAALPWPPTYNTGAGGPVNAATGQPLQSFQQWQQQNPGGMSINSTPQAPQAPSPMAGYNQARSAAEMGAPSNLASAYQMGDQQMSQMMSDMAANPNLAQQRYGNLPMFNQMLQQTQQGQGAAGGQQGSGAPPNNWQAAINALANPGNPVTRGANVPLATGTQPAGGVNQAFLQQAGAGQGMNQNFLSALRAIQGR
jgi:hypothetical protein